MSDFSSRIHLFDQKLTLSPDIASSFDGWSAVNYGGKPIRLDLDPAGLDAVIGPACGDFSRMIGPQPAALDPTQVNTALQNSFGKISLSTWATIAEGLSALGRMTWPKLTIPTLNPFSKEPAQIGRLQPDGTSFYTGGTGLIDGFGADLHTPGIYWRRYAFATHIDVSPILYVGTDAMPWKANPLRGGGIGIRIGDGVKIEAGVGFGQTGSIAGGLQLKIDMWRP